MRGSVYICFRCGNPSPSDDELTERYCPSCGEEAMYTHVELSDIINDWYIKEILPEDLTHEEEDEYEYEPLDFNDPL